MTPASAAEILFCSRQFPKKPDETQCDTATAPSAERGEDRSPVRQ
jgi:hypothetical protein